MPRSNRDNLLRLHAQAVNDLERCMSNMQIMSETYGPDYPDQQDMIILLASSIVSLLELWMQFREEKM